MPATSSAPPNVVSPVPTVKVLTPVIVVGPFSAIFPVPVVNPPDPVCVMFPKNAESPVTLSVPVLFVFPFKVKSPVPLVGEISMFPVVSPPIVKVLFAVVCIDLGAPARVRLPETEAFPVVVSVVKAPVEGVVKPIAVPFIPVEVRLKLPEATSKLFTPKSRFDANNPVRFKAPDVPVKFTAPVVIVIPFDPVKRPADVIVPAPVVSKLPEVVRFPFSEILNVADPEERASNTS